MTPLPLPWSDIDTVLLDMDGTLLDKYFDDYFWEEYVPRAFAEQNGLAYPDAQAALLARYQAVESTLQWSDIDFWTGQLGLDIPTLKAEVAHLITVHPHVETFLSFLTAQKKPLFLVTAAHPKTLQLKLGKTGLGNCFDEIISISDIGKPKESPDFWHCLEDQLGFDRRCTFMADDTVKVLEAAQTYGIGHLVHIARPSSRRAPRYHDAFLSIATFDELIP